jgi:DNA-binding transcriptional MocR family regulator|tara:strand:+ start:499 stop:789 length:291 start_codon:yes stop_codon:yes gene_type:complete
MSSLTSEQIIQEIEKAFADGRKRNEENVYTMKELRALMGMSASSVYARLDVLENAGRLECTTKIVQTRNVSTGGHRVSRPVTAYRILPSSEDDGSG